MSPILQKTLDALKAGKQFIAVQSDDGKAYANALHKLTGKQKDRALFVWEPSGLRSLTFTDEYPETANLAEALDFLKALPVDAAFLFDCRQIADELSENAENLSRRFAFVDQKLWMTEKSHVILLVSAPLPAELEQHVYWVGGESEQPADSTEQRPQPRTGRSSQWSGIRDLKTFDSKEWFDRLNALTAEEIADIVDRKAYEPALHRVKELRELLKGRFAQKGDVLEAMFASAVAQVPTVLMGPPGTAKGQMIRSLCEGLGLAASSDANGRARQYFEYQLTRFTTPEEIFGPVHVQKLIEEQSYRRVTDGYLPTAHIAFLDEIFKASSAILNTLLSLLNERIFYNEGKPETVPLTTIFAASNEPPQDENLAALFDRFPIRINCPSVDDNQLDSLLDHSWEAAFKREFSATRSTISQQACANDLRLLHKVSRAMFGGRKPASENSADGSQSFYSEFLRFYRALRGENGISDRTMGSLFTWSRAHALLRDSKDDDGRTRMTTEDLKVFQYIQWDPSGGTARTVRNLKRTWEA